MRPQSPPPPATIAPFGFQTASRIRFGRGEADRAHLDIVDLAPCALLVRGRAVPWVDDLVVRLAGAGCTVHQVICAGEPTITEVDAAAALGRKVGAGAVVAVGGGSVLDLGKAAAALIPAPDGVMGYLEGVGAGRKLDQAPLPVIAIPTTAGTGSEVTRNAVIGVPEAGRKVSLRDDRMIPQLAIVDPALTDHAPRGVTLASGLDALTQVIEPYLSVRANPLTDALCRGAIPMGLSALRVLSAREDPAARDAMAYVSLIGGTALANAGLGAVHGLAGVIGGRFGAPHGLICGRLLGPVLCLNRDAAARAGGAGTDRYAAIAQWLAQGLDLPQSAPFEALPGWLEAQGLPWLDDWIGPDDDLAAVATEALAASSMKANPHVPTVPDLVHALRAACRPTAI